jgi:hypothetical protein
MRNSGLIQYPEATVTFDCKPDGESQKGAAEHGAKQFSEKTLSDASVLGFFSCKITDALNEVTGSGALLSTADAKVRPFAAPQVLPLEKFMKHELLGHAITLMRNGNKARSIDHEAGITVILPRHWRNRAERGWLVQNEEQQDQCLAPVLSFLAILRGKADGILPLDPG